MSAAFVLAAPASATWRRRTANISSQRHRTIFTAQPRRRPCRAGLYPDVDPPESVPNPMEGEDEERRSRRERKGAGKSGDALDDDVLQRARRLFGGVADDEDARRKNRYSSDVDSDTSAASADSLDTSLSSAPGDDDRQSSSTAPSQSPAVDDEALKAAPLQSERDSLFRGAGQVRGMSDVESPKQSPDSSAGVGGWFGFGRRKNSGREEEQPQSGSASTRNSSQSSTQASAPLGADASWPADEIDVAAADGIIRDSKGLAADGSGTGNGVGGLDSSNPSTQTNVDVEGGIDIQRASRAFWKVGWWTWWIQLVLTTISGVIVLFAFAFPGVNIRSTASASGFVCAGAGVAIAFISLLWTYGYTRLAVRLRRAQPKWIKNAPDKVAAYLRMAIVLALSGMLVSLIGLQAIVGTLLARLFGAGIATTPYTALQAGAANSQANAAVLGGLGSVQPVDILVIQASANAMSALLTALVSAIWFRGRLLRFWTRKRV